MEDDMRRFVVIFLVILMIMLAGCQMPFSGKSKGEPSAITDGQEMVIVDDSTHTDITEGSRANASEHGDFPIEGAENTPVGNRLDATGSPADRIDDGASKSAGEGALINESAVLTAQSNASSSLLYSEPRRPVTVYYQDADGFLVPMTRWIQPQPGIARANVSLTIDSALAREEVAYYGVYPVIPQDTDILGIDVRNGVAIIDFSRHLLNYGSAVSERNIIAAIVYTLTGFETIERVRILINGYPQGILKYGTDLSCDLGREDVMINTDVLIQAGTRKVDIYFLKQANAGYIYPVPLSVENTAEADELPEALVELLVSTKAGGGLYSEIPENVFLRDSSVSDGVITLDFSEGFLNYGGTMREEGILKQLAYTLRQCDSIRAIRITVNGREAELPEGTDISAGLAIPATINDVMDR
jgi:germination protein M